jgi:peptidoglycan/LPS O-acetylase OafA/YrhL
MRFTKPAPALLQTKQHFEILDGLRGIAAVAVVIFHFMEIAVPEYPENFIAHGYLAVDFFFCLSGFVIAYAYDNRIKSIGVAQFFRLRLIRLHPLVVIGSVLGILSFIFDPFSHIAAGFSTGKLLLVFIASCLMIPYPVVPERFFNLFHLNPPTWSLLWEYIANILYALLLFKLRNKLLWILTILAAVSLIYTAVVYKNLSVGWGVGNIAGGGVRVLYSFLAGLLVYRCNWIIRSPIGFISVGILLLLAFLVPYSDAVNWITEPLIVIFYFPLLVALGAGARLSESLRKICIFSGAISYPLYMVHYPFIWLFFGYIETQKPPLKQWVMVTAVAVILLIVFSWLVMLFVDIPLRNYLKKRMQKSMH